MKKPRTMTAGEVAAVIKTSGLTLEAITAALAKPEDKDKDKDKKPPIPISNQLQVSKAGPGVRHVKGVVGLYLRKSSNDSGAWFRRYWFNGMRREMGLGPITKVSLAEAKKKARDFENDRENGDPIELRRAAKAKLTPVAITGDRWDFIMATDEYLKAHQGSWKHPRAAQIWHSPIARYAHPVIGRKPLDDIQVQDIDAIMTAAAEGSVTKSGKKRTAEKVAPRIRLRIEQIFNAAIVKGQRNAGLGNPARLGLLKAIRPMPKHRGKPFDRIPLNEAPAAFQRLRELAKDSTPFAALCFAFLTAARPSEAINAKWDEIDLEQRLWTVPAERMKANKPHEVPLSELAVEILNRQKKVYGTGGVVFPGRRGDTPIAYPTFFIAAKRKGIEIGTPHSWRSIFRDWAGDIGRIDRDLAEAALAHALLNVEASYRRGSALEARRQVMGDYAGWLTGESAKVIPFPAARA
jgi:integrase